MPATITVTGNCITINGNLCSKSSLTFLRTNPTVFTANTPLGSFANLTAANTTLNGVTYATLDDLFDAFKTTVY